MEPKGLWIEAGGLHRIGDLTPGTLCYRPQDHEIFIISEFRDPDNWVKCYSARSGGLYRGGTETPKAFLDLLVKPLAFNNFDTNLEIVRIDTTMRAPIQTWALTPEEMIEALRIPSYGFGSYLSGLEQRSREIIRTDSEGIHLGAISHSLYRFDSGLYLKDSETITFADGHSIEVQTDEPEQIEPEGYTLDEIERELKLIHQGAVQMIAAYDRIYGLTPIFRDGGSGARVFSEPELTVFREAASEKSYMVSWTEAFLSIKHSGRLDPLERVLAELKETSHEIEADEIPPKVRKALRSIIRNLGRLAEAIKK